MNQDLMDMLKQKVSPLDYLDYRQYLDAVYQIVKSKLNRYSYIRFSEDLGFSRTNVLHLIIKGKRPLTSKAASKVIAALQLSGPEKKYFVNLVKYQNARQPQSRENLFQELLQIKSKVLSQPESQSQLEFFSEWFHVIIYQMTFMADFNADPSYIAKAVKPNIRPEQARKSLQLLKSLKLIEDNPETGRLEPTKLRVTTGDEVASIAVTRYHQRMIDLGKESITSVPDQERDISSVSISIPMTLLPSLKEEISVFRKKILALADQKRNQCDEVYQMNIQLFPTTDLNKGDK
ncbi:TIGR02147 family protein [Pseudobacteriovorax antillogorgiicola]|uniref:TIGR02147 family protein n=1 Tax=Pseudobacteriovorax antillogorgiicola TaxID=1513793 RepID=A0A1Y6C8M7_9BACT|nr:TIGR02147 family protein [Pseudobacteriovorax antillogorgiicola]TCS51706.1 uncharacterized protein (TIGR02147 family) [Pseudobacteriovorax antillogorgiicola]SMF49273.1 TIGR02147 family protein [Pseudobacteriovorax antillogorgiicola]